MTIIAPLVSHREVARRRPMKSESVESCFSSAASNLFMFSRRGVLMSGSKVLFTKFTARFLCPCRTISMTRSAYSWNCLEEFESLQLLQFDRPPWFGIPCVLDPPFLDRLHFLIELAHLG